MVTRHATESGAENEATLDIMKSALSGGCVGSKESEKNVESFREIFELGPVSLVLEK